MNRVIFASSLLALAAAKPYHGLSSHRHGETSDNWAGVVTEGKNVNHVTGTIVVPDISGGSSDNCTSFWVGIDGYNCKSKAIEQLGIDLCGDGSVRPWFEWYPDDNIYRDDFKVSTGDKMRFTVDSSAKDSGTATMDNLTTGKSIEHTWTKNDAELCQKEADWIVEDFGSPPVPYVDFGSVTFTDASASTDDDDTLSPSEGTLITMERDGTVMTTCSRNGDDVTCTWESN